MQLETARLVLRPHGTQYLTSTYAYSSVAENTRYMSYLPNRDLQECCEFLLSVDAEWQKPEPEFYEFAILLDGAHIGAVGLYWLPDHSGASLGWILHRDYWQRGYTTEAARAVIGFAARQLKISRFIARCDAENIASACVMQKLGMQLTDRRPGRKNRASKKPGEELTYELLL